MTAADAGWGSGRSRNKADVAGALMSARAYELWYHEWLEACPDRSPDLILPLANEYGVRPAINRRGECIILHGTTSRWWQANCHRHIAGRDGCIECRFPEDAPPEMVCSEAPLARHHAGDEPVRDREPDAALPFLSAAAGVLLLAALHRLQLGQLSTERCNAWVAYFEGRPGMRADRWLCDAACSRVLPFEVRRQLPGRWRAIQ